MRLDRGAAFLALSIAGCQVHGSTSEEFCQMVASVENDAHLGDLEQPVTLFCGKAESGACSVLETSWDAVWMTCDGCPHGCVCGLFDAECADDTQERHSPQVMLQHCRTVS